MEIILVAFFSWLIGLAIVYIWCFATVMVFKVSDIDPANAFGLAFLWPVSLPYLLIRFLVRRIHDASR